MILNFVWHDQLLLITALLFVHYDKNHIAACWHHGDWLVD